ncbi:MAG: chemotaxis protein CheA [Candidatus Riflebacteria bacterium]|nr:chemotaxis protein CheA [Candidatus Riflebacteria bacterium]
MSEMSRDEEWKSILAVFISESSEMLDEVEPKLVDLERSSSSEDSSIIINSIFRLFHTLKGGAASLGLNVIRDLTHQAETFFDLFRTGDRTISPEDIDLLGLSVDFLREILDRTSMEFDDTALRVRAEELTQKIVQRMKPGSSIKPAKSEPLKSVPSKPEPIVESAQSNCLEANLDLSEDFEADFLNFNAQDFFNSENEAEISNLKDISESLLEMNVEITPEMEKIFIKEVSEFLKDAGDAVSSLDLSPQKDSIVKACRAIKSCVVRARFFNFFSFSVIGSNINKILCNMHNGSIPITKGVTSAILNGIDSLKNALANYDNNSDFYLSNEDELVAIYTKILKEPQLLKKSPIGQILVDSGYISEDALQEALHIQKQEEEKPFEKKADSLHAGSEASSQKQAIRVTTEKLDSLVELVGELVISVANIANCPQFVEIKRDRLEKAFDRLNKITKDLQNVAMSVRMIPVSGLFRKMVRPVRDLAKGLGRKIDLKFVGEETEVDKNVIEQISDPLMHMIRNSVDHGIEAPEKRAMVGKPEMGVITLEARHSGSEVLIIVKDDGQGLNRERILEKAIKNGLFDGKPDSIRDEDVYKFIFEPGFSTAEAVTEVSGRGVGMDVVRKNIEKLKGRIEIKSVAGSGTQFIIRIPLTMAIIDGMVVRVGKERYIIPTQNIIEVFRPKSDCISRVSQHGELISIRGNLLPLYRIGEIFGINVYEKEPTRANIMIIESDGQSFGFLVDEIIGQQQTVIKTLGDKFGNMPGVSGAAVMPDGRVGLILDASGMRRLAQNEIS